MAIGTKDEFLRKLPAVGELINDPAIVYLRSSYPRGLIVSALRRIIQDERARLLSPEYEGDYQFSRADLGRRVEAVVASLRAASLKPVINATGVVLHTNLGRAPLALEAIDAIHQVASSYCNLEIRLETGERGDRYIHVEDLVKQLTGAEAALVVNNNAGAVLLALNSLAAGREVIVSRGELVEIGGSFRMPDVMRASGARLKEVGTTNKTYLKDYEAAIGPETALLLKVHTSNFRIVGFTADVALEELKELGRRTGLTVMHDLGSGCLVDLTRQGLPAEPTLQGSVASGADLVTVSGDKLLGGPQAGILAGRREYVEAARTNPLARALRVDKLTLAALEATLRLYLEEEPWARVPALRMLSMPLAEVEKRAEQLIALVREGGAVTLSLAIKEGYSQAGGGSLPGNGIPTKLVAITWAGQTAAHLEQGLRQYDPPIVGRVHGEELLLDLRTVAEDEVPVVARALVYVSSSSVKTVSR